MNIYLMILFCMIIFQILSIIILQSDISMMENNDSVNIYITDIKGNLVKKYMKVKQSRGMR